ncbi:MAG: sulfotransferase family 2 domain-containing protein [Xanthomonadales bacterium]|nr:sulfotransferase family 2 domain-containing protein [Xanthomonadales bacterium]
MICRAFNCLFVHIPKTAGQSVEQFFMNQLHLDWNEDREALLLQGNEDRTRGTEKLAHLSASEYVDDGYIGREDFSALFKFSFVRNPWERILSEYRYRNYFQHRSFRDFVLNKLPQPGWDDQYRHVMPQYDMLHDRQGNLLVDFIGRFESLQQDFDLICERLDIADSRLPHRNRSDKKSRDLKRKLRNALFRNGENQWRGMEDFYDDETRKAVAEYYRKDIETFGYEF